MKGNLYIIAGCSGVGKGTLIKLFLEKNPQIKLSVSATTRKPREGEQDGVNYFFISQDEFKKSVENNEFLEWAEFSGNYYGTKKSFVEKTLNKGIDLILEIDVQGAKQIKEEGGDVKAFLAEKEQEYSDLFANPYQAATYGYIDDVIEPRNTRFRVCRALAQLQTKQQHLPAKKHGCIPM